jgi:hypothetical protein
MARATVTNAQFDTACAAVPAPFGPLTRVSDLETAPTVAPNSHIAYETTSAADVTVWISYEDLATTVRRNDIIKDAHGVNAYLYDLSVLVDALDDIMSTAPYDPLTAPPSDYRIILRMLAAMGNIATSLMPYEAYEEVRDSNQALDIEFTASQVDATLISTVTLDNTSTGLVSGYLLDWGDGSGFQQTDVEADWVHVYDRAAMGAGDDVYNVTLIGVGPQGVQVDVVAVTIPDQV